VGNTRCIPHCCGAMQISQAMRTTHQAYGCCHHDRHGGTQIRAMRSMPVWTELQLSADPADPYALDTMKHCLPVICQ
jgi:hypothetical protein